MRVDGPSRVLAALLAVSAATSSSPSAAVPGPRPDPPAAVHLSVTAAQPVPSHQAPTRTSPSTTMVTIPAGALTITTPYTSSHPLELGPVTPDGTGATFSASAPLDRIVVMDRRAGNPGFALTVVVGTFRGGRDSFPGSHAGLTGLVATQVPGNAMRASDVALVDHPPTTDGLGTAKLVASYPAQHSIGSVAIGGTFRIDQVPTSLQPGRYTSLVTFTAF